MIKARRTTAGFTKVWQDIVKSATVRHQLWFGILGLENHQIYFKIDLFYAAFS